MGLLRTRAKTQRSPGLPGHPPSEPEGGETGGGGTAGGRAADPTLTPATKLVIADIALRGGGQLLRRVVDHGLLGKSGAPGKGPARGKSRSIGQTLIGAAITRIATRSVPGALIVGGGLLAKTLYDRKRSKDAASKDGSAIADPSPRRDKTR